MFKIKNLKNSNQGFGLIELMVSISIVVLVTSIILAKHDSYNSAVLLRSQAYDIALKMREIQLLAVSAVNNTNGQESNFRNEIGLYFNKTHPDYYLIYVDSSEGVNDNSRYDLGEAIGQRGKIDKRFTISDLRVIGANGFSTSVDEISVVFKRPNFDARFFTNSATESSAAAVEIDLGLNTDSGSQTPTGSLRTMQVSKTGQIIVKPLSTNASTPNPDPIIVEPEPDPEPNPDPKINVGAEGNGGGTALPLEDGGEEQ